MPRVPSLQIHFVDFFVNCHLYFIVGPSGGVQESLNNRQKRERSRRGAPASETIADSCPSLSAITRLSRSFGSDWVDRKLLYTFSRNFEGKLQFTLLYIPGFFPSTFYHCSVFCYFLGILEKIRTKSYYQQLQTFR